MRYIWHLNCYYVLAMNKKMLLLVVGILLATAEIHQASAFVNPMRCGDTGDSLAGGAEAQGRREWAWKCFPDFRGLIKRHDKWVDENGGTRDGYPVIGVVDENGDFSNPHNWFAPTNPNAPCDFPTGYTIIGYCAAGCYTPDQMIWFNEGHISIGEAFKQKFQEIMTLTSSSDRNNLTFQVSPIDYFITDLIERAQTILTIHTLSGGSLKVTENHALVDSEGRMRSADSMKPGEGLITAQGEVDPIISIIPEQYFGKVYNVEVKTDNLTEKIMVAQGYLNGSVYFQNDITHMNRLILRSNLIADEIVR